MVNPLAATALRRNFIRQIEELKRLPDRYNIQDEIASLIKKIETLDHMTIEGSERQSKLEG